jgi:hypothetical protein
MQQRAMFHIPAVHPVNAPYKKHFLKRFFYFFEMLLQYEFEILSWGAFDSRVSNAFILFSSGRASVAERAGERF